ncbi:MAG TPA: restriction endonuclease [Candidatus Absconditabacterales bacterium]|nr:restriction endonuclease [Candidatus Absconditabacterales bacterium]
MTFEKLYLKYRIIDKYTELSRLSKIGKIKIKLEDRYTLLRFMGELTWKGFEEYIGDYFKYIEHAEVKVVGGLDDQGVDVRVRIDSHHCLAVQCKNQIKSHTTKKEIMEFIDNTKKFKRKYKSKGQKLDLYFITTNWINKQARNKAYGIVLWDYRKILEMDRDYPIEEFIKAHKGKENLFTGINSEEVLDKYGLKKMAPFGFLGRFLVHPIYWIFKNIVFRFSNLRFDHDRLGLDKKISGNDWGFIR